MWVRMTNSFLHFNEREENYIDKTCYQIKTQATHQETQVEHKKVLHIDPSFLLETTATYNESSSGYQPFKGRYGAKHISIRQGKITAADYLQEQNSNSMIKNMHASRLCSANHAHIVLFLIHTQNSTGLLTSRGYCFIEADPQPAGATCLLLTPSDVTGLQSAVDRVCGKRGELCSRTHNRAMLPVW